ncbi:hypothetical protein [Geodermatophilus sp. SYSU D00700]
MTADGTPDRPAGPARRPPVVRRVAGVLLGIVVTTLLTQPIAVAALFSYAAFSGCLVDCADPPDLGGGLLWSAVTAVGLAIPLALGMAVAGVRSRRAWLAAGAVVLGLVVAWAVAGLLG